MNYRLQSLIPGFNTRLTAKLRDKGPTVCLNPDLHDCRKSGGTVETIQGCAFSPPLYSVYKHERAVRNRSNSTLRFTEDTEGSPGKSWLLILGGSSRETCVD